MTDDHGLRNSRPPGRPKTALTLSPEERATLTEWAKGTPDTPSPNGDGGQLALRSRIILACATGRRTPVSQSISASPDRPWASGQVAQQVRRAPARRTGRRTPSGASPVDDHRGDPRGTQGTPPRAPPRPDGNGGLDPAGALPPYRAVGLHDRPDLGTSRHSEPRDIIRLFVQLKLISRAKNNGPATDGGSISRVGHFGE